MAEICNASVELMLQQVAHRREVPWAIVQRCIDSAPKAQHNQSGMSMELDLDIVRGSDGPQGWSLSRLCPLRPTSHSCACSDNICMLYLFVYFKIVSTTTDFRVHMPVPTMLVRAWRES